MDEKILIKSEPYNIKKFTKIVLIVCVILAPFLFLGAAVGNPGDYIDEYYSQYREHHQYYDDCWDGHWDDWDAFCYYGGCEGHNMNESKLQYTLIEMFSYINVTYGLLWLIPLGGILALTVLIYFWLRSYELTVTDKRIYGTVAFGKRVDLPVDSVSATSTISLFKGVSVSTASGGIRFLLIKNANQIYETLSKLIIDRQQAKQNPVPAPSAGGDTADQLKKFKELLDSGVISQEEFDAKKKQLLGL